MMGLGEPAPVPANFKGPGKTADYKMLTSLFLEMEACKSRGCWHWEFMQQPKQERLKWLLYERMVRKRKIHFNKLEIEQMKKDQAVAKAKATRPGRRPR